MKTINYLTIVFTLLIGCSPKIIEEELRSSGYKSLTRSSDTSLFSKGCRTEYQAIDSLNMSQEEIDKIYKGKFTLLQDVNNQQFKYYLYALFSGKGEFVAAKLWIPANVNIKDNDFINSILILKKRLKVDVMPLYKREKLLGPYIISLEHSDYEE